jgi:hypothetical protein
LLDAFPDTHSDSYSHHNNLDNYHDDDNCTADFNNFDNHSNHDNNTATDYNYHDNDNTTHNYNHDPNSNHDRIHNHNHDNHLDNYSHHDNDNGTYHDNDIAGNITNNTASRSTLGLDRHWNRDRCRHSSRGLDTERNVVLPRPRDRYAEFPTKNLKF